MKVLIVDDVVEAAEILAEGARLAQCNQVDVVGSGGDAIGRAIMDQYDLITLDLRMPGVSGLDALSVIRGLRPHAIIAIISAYVKELNPDALSAADVVLSKPVSLKTFQDVVRLTREIHDRRNLIRQLGLQAG
jgi:CheY-like chemotaxis protein